MKNLNLFAIEQDLIKMLTLVEQRTPLKYVKTGHSPAQDHEEYLTASEIPDLGVARYESSTNCDSYLVLDRSTQVRYRTINNIRLGTLFSVDQLLNPDSVTFTGAGIFTSNIVLHGRIATASDSAGSQALMKAFSAALKKDFKKVKAYWLGPGAYTLFEDGHRMTAAAQSPAEFDLTL